MANDLTVVVDKILARGLMALREWTIMPALVNTDYGSDAKSLGDTIDVPIPASQTAVAVTPAEVPPAPASKTPTKVQISLDQWYKTDFHMTDKQVLEVDANALFIPMQTSEALKALANKINQNIFSHYTGVYGYVGTAATTPFSTDTSAAVDAGTALNLQLAPPGDRRGVLNFTAEGAAKKLAAFQDVDKAGSTGVKIEGSLGRQFGIQWYADHHVPNHTTAAAGTPLVDDAAAIAIGATTIHMDGLTTKPEAGDVFSTGIAGDSGTYTVVSSTTLAGTDSDVTFYPGLRVAKPAVDASEAITFKGSHAVNLVFHRDAFAFAMRPLEATDFGLGSVIRSMTDPVSGISLRLEVSRQYKQTAWVFDALWGAKLVRPEFAVRIAG